MFSKSSEVKIYIPRDSNGKPLVKKGKYWYVYCYFDNPKTGKRDYKYIVKGNINRLKTIRLRKEKAKIIQSALILAIKDGFSPLETNNKKFDLINILCVDALNIAIKNKQASWGNRMKQDATSYLSSFTTFARENNIEFLPINKINKRHITAYLNELVNKRGLTPKTRNNHKAALSSLFTQLVDDDYLNYNICKDIPNLKTEPQKNTPFTLTDLKKIKKELLKNDPYLYDYILFLGYGFLRSVDAIRIKIKNINLENNTISIKTKTGYQTIFIIDKLVAIIGKYKIDTLDNEFNLFTPQKKPAIWNIKDRDKRGYFGKKFSKLKTKLKLNKNYSLHSFRHTFVLDLYNSYLNKGLTQLQIKQKLMTITRHKSMSGLENYLRGIGAILPDDFKDDFTIDF